MFAAGYGLYAEWSGDALTVVVTGSGCGVAATPRRRLSASTSGGCGLLLIDKVTDQLHVDPGQHGTRVTATWRPAALRQNAT